MRLLMTITLLVCSICMNAQSTGQGFYPGGGSTTTSVAYPRWEVVASQDVVSSVAAYGFAAVYTSNSTPAIASTASSATLHQYYVTAEENGYYVHGAGSLTVTATFSYQVGQNYYLNDTGTLSTFADDEFDSAVVYVVASLGGGSFIINLADPRHFAN